METVWQDVRHALRCLRRAPAFTSAVVLTTVSFVGAPFFRTPVALAACFWPAVRAARVGPVITRRAE
jgi:hypothetical protein